MSATNEPVTGLAILGENQAGAHIPANMLFRVLARLAQLTVLSSGDNSPAGGEADGAAYIVGGTPAGDFAAFAEHDVAILLESTWYAFTPEEGWLAYVQDLNVHKKFDGTDWATSVS